MTDSTQDYINLMTDVVQKQSEILGPGIAVIKAKSVKELTVSDDGKVTACSGDPNTALQKLIEAYVSLSGQIVHSALTPIFGKYPAIQTGEK